jgi:O-antigen/teichoic acid export membrane protein
VFVIFGFIMPRVVSDTIGQEALGIWDFGWAIVNYLGLAMVGIGSSVNRFVARFRASGQAENLSRIVSSVVAVQAAIGGAVFVTTFALYFLIPVLFSARLGEHAEVASVIVLYLGSALAVQMIFDAFRGVLTGCHRWTTYNAINAIGYSVAATLMLIVLAHGGGLRGMAITFLAVTLATEIVRYFIARRICPEIELKSSNVNRADIATVFRFGFKNVLIGLPKIIVQQTVNVFVVIHLGPAMLAVFARPLALVSQIGTLINKFAFVLTPMAGSLQSTGENRELRSFALSTMRAGWILSVLPMAFLLVLGDRIVEVWMGEGYAHWAVMAILAVGSLLPNAQNALLTVLVGMDEHGKVAKVSLWISIVVAIPGFVLVSFLGWSLEAAAWLVVLPTNAGMAAVTLWAGCKALRISAKLYIARVLRDPLIVLAAVCSALYLVRIFGPDSIVSNLAVGAAVLAAVSGLMLHKDVRAVLRSL